MVLKKKSKINKRNFIILVSIDRENSKCSFYILKIVVHLKSNIN